MRTTATVLAVGLLLAGCGGRYEVAYDDVFAARAQDAVERGWIPETLPEGTTDIREVHLPDTGASLLRATLPGSGVVLAGCAGSSDVPPAPSLQADWFPSPLPEGTTLSCTDDAWVRLDGRTIYRWIP